ncbi:MAG: hypothetical protein M9939_00585 [Mesorhizobium sp.]|nr:hypothetical protein [Mesorhizobium sp.]MCO5159603.1 hypothetical protein [Mesorhizobium sp.]
MTIDEKIVRAYLQDAHNKGGGWKMAMFMMADRLLVLEDRLLRAGVDFPTDPRGALIEPIPTPP